MLFNLASFFLYLVALHCSIQRDFNANVFPLLFLCAVFLEEASEIFLCDWIGSEGW
jgi:hypothetical protein